MKKLTTVEEDFRAIGLLVEDTGSKVKTTKPADLNESVERFLKKHKRNRKG